MPEHWSDGLTHERLVTPEAKANLRKFDSEEAAHIGYLDLQTSAGKPFKLPKTLEAVDHWPDEADRDGFRAQLKALNTVEYDPAQLDDVNYAEGLADATTVNEGVRDAFKTFLKENKVSKALAQKIAAFSNGQSILLRSAQSKAADDNATIVKATTEGLYGGEEGVAKHQELVKRMADQHGGLTPEEGEVLVGLLKTGTAKNVVLTKFLYNLAKKVVPEGETEQSSRGPGSEKTESEQTKEQMPATAAVLDW